MCQLPNIIYLILPSSIVIIYISVVQKLVLCVAYQVLPSGQKLQKWQESTKTDKKDVL